MDIVLTEIDETRFVVALTFDADDVKAHSLPTGHDSLLLLRDPELDVEDQARRVVALYLVESAAAAARQPTQRKIEAPDKKLLAEAKKAIGSEDG